MLNLNKLGKKLALFVSIFAFLLPLRLEAQKANIDLMLKSARKSYSSGNAQAAINTYWRILEKAPEKLIAHLELGDIYLHLDMYDKAIELLEPALDNASKNNMDNEILCKYYCSLTSAYIATKNEGKSNQYLIKAAQCSPKNPMPRVLLGDIYASNKKYSNAAKAYGQALMLDENCKQAADKLDLLILQHGDKLKGVKRKPSNYISSNKSNEKNSNKYEEENKSQPDTVDVDDSVVAYKTEENTETEETQNDDEYESEENSYNDTEASSEETDQYYVDMLMAGEIKDRERAAAYFVHKGEEGLNKIEDLMYNANPDVRIIAVRTMSRFTDCKKQVKSILLDFEDDNNVDVAAEVKEVLKTLEDVVLE